MGRTFAELSQAPPNLKREEVHPEIPGWEGTYFIHQLTGTGVQAVYTRFNELTGGNISEATDEKSVTQKTTEHGIEFQILVLSYALSDEEGNNPPYEWLAGHAWDLLRPLCAKAMDINGLSEKAQEEIAKNSPDQGE